MFGPSHSAFAGSGWVSMKNPCTPTAAARRAIVGIISRSPALTLPPWPLGRWTLWVTSCTTSPPDLLILGRLRASTTRSPYPSIVPRSVSSTSSSPCVIVTFFAASSMVSADSIWPFFMFTSRPDLAAATSRSVWRLRNAGIWSTSATLATGATWYVSWMSVSTGKPVSVFTRWRISRPFSMPGPRKLLRSWRLALSKLALKMTGISSSFCISTSPLGYRHNQLLRLNHAWPSDEEERLGLAQRRRQYTSFHLVSDRWCTTGMKEREVTVLGTFYVVHMNHTVTIPLRHCHPQTEMVGAWKRLKTLSGAALRVERLSTSSSSAEAAVQADPSPVKYENVRKLVVGLGNPGEKYARTRHNIGSTAVVNFLDTYVHDVLGKKMTLQHEDNNHGDVSRFLLPYQQDVDDDKYSYRVDDLINRSSQRHKDKTLEEGVPHESVNVALLNPTTYMNRSGVAVKTFMNNHNWRLKKNAMSLNRQDELLVITDDVSLPFGTCRFKGKGGPGGQNGIRDIIKCVGSERFARLKIGVGAPEWFAGGQSGAPSGTAMDKFVLARFNADEQDQLPLLLEYVNELLRLFLHRGLATASTIANSNDLSTYKKQFKAQSPKRSKK